jgi:hypothetical protein
MHEPGHPWRHLLLQFTEITRAQAVAEGLLAPGEVDDLKAALRAHLDDPATAVISPLLIQAWGRRAPG